MTNIASRRNVLLAVGVAVLVGLLAITSAATARSADVAAAEAVATQAFRAEHELGNLPGSAAKGPMEAATRTAMIQHADTVLRGLFTGKALASDLDSIPTAIANEGTDNGIYIWDGGVSKLDVLSSVVIDDTATVVLRATAYLVLSRTIDSERSRPENTADVTLGLLKQGGRWLVATEEVAFLPGQAP